MAASGVCHFSSRTATAAVLLLSDAGICDLPEFTCDSADELFVTLWVIIDSGGTGRDTRHTIFVCDHRNFGNL